MTKKTITPLFKPICARCVECNKRIWYWQDSVILHEPVEQMKAMIEGNIHYKIKYSHSYHW